MLHLLSSRGVHLNHKESLFAVVYGIVIVFGSRGLMTLKRIGYGNIPITFYAYSIIFIITLIFLPYMNIVGKVFFEIIICSWMMVFAAMFPLSIYLIYRQRKSTSQQESANES
jgi:hypothetical protein